MFPACMHCIMPLLTQPRSKHWAHGLINQEVHADLSTMTRSSVSAAAYAIAARMSSTTRSGWFARISRSVSPEASRPKSRDAGNRSPRIHGQPPMIAGFTVIRLIVIADLSALAIPEELSARLMSSRLLQPSSKRVARGWLRRSREANPIPTLRRASEHAFMA